MAYLSPIVSHEGGIDRRMGLRRALITQRASLADGFDTRSIVRRLLSEASMRYPTAVVPLARKQSGEHSAVELALQVAARAVAGLDREAIDGIAYCHAVPDEQPTDSSVGRLQFELGLHHAFPFSVSQAHNTAVPIALDIAAALIHGPEAARNVLVVATDKLLFGPAPHEARRMRWRDVAAAAVVSRERRAGWQLHEVAIHHFATALRAHQHWPEAEREAFAAFCAERIGDCLGGLGLAPGELAAVVPVCPDAALERQVHERTGLAALRHEKPDGFRAAHIASADLLVRLAGMESRLDTDRPVLAWCTGNNGEFACCVLTRTA